MTGNVTLYAKWTENAPAPAPATGGKKSGCGSSVMGQTSAILGLALLALAGVVVLKKKKAKNN